MIEYDNFLKASARFYAILLRLKDRAKLVGARYLPMQIDHLTPQIAKKFLETMKQEGPSRPIDVTRTLDRSLIPTLTTFKEYAEETSGYESLVPYIVKAQREMSRVITLAGLYNKALARERGTGRAYAAFRIMWRTRELAFRALDRFVYSLRFADNAYKQKDIENQARALFAFVPNRADMITLSNIAGGKTDLGRAYAVSPTTKYKAAHLLRRVNVKQIELRNALDAAVAAYGDNWPEEAQEAVERLNSFIRYTRKTLEALAVFQKAIAEGE